MLPGEIGKEEGGRKRTASARPRKVTSAELSGSMTQPRCADAEARGEPYTPILPSHGQRAQSQEGTHRITMWVSVGV